MRIKILSSAVEDLHAGRLFYESQGEGLGEYFFDSLFSDIDSLVLYSRDPSGGPWLSPSPVEAISVWRVLPT